MTTTGSFRIDPLKFYTTGLDLGVDIPRYAAEGSAAAKEVYGSMPPSQESPKETKDFGYYVNKAADIAEGISGAVRAFKGLPPREQEYYRRPAGERLGEFMRRMEEKEARTQSEDDRLKNYQRVIMEMFGNPEVLSDLLVRLEENKKKKEEERIIRAEPATSPTQATPVQ